jgi:hypothetical protein
VGRVILVLLCAALAAPLGADAAKTARVRYAVTVRATVELEWQHQLRRDIRGCAFSSATSGSQRFEFRSVRPRIVAFKARSGRVRSLAASFGSLTVRASGAGETTVVTCGQTTTSECVLGPPAFSTSGSFARLRRGVLGLSGFAAPELEPWAACIPRSLVEPEYLPFSRAAGTFGERALVKRRTTVVVADRESVTRLNSVDVDEQGFLAKHATWSLTFRRLGRR